MISLLEVSGVSVTFDGFRAINNLSFRIGPQELRAIIGPNGAGKTAFMDIATGKTHPDTGTVTFGPAGRTCCASARRRSRRRGSGARSSARPSSRTRRCSRTWRWPFATPRGPFTGLADRMSAADRDRVQAPAEAIGLKDHLPRKSGERSHDQKRWLEIGMLLAQEPRLLLLDVPTEGIQPDVVQQIGRVIEHLRAEGGMAIVLVEQYFDFATGLGDRFVVMKRGRVTLAGAKADLPREALRAAATV